MTRRRRTGEGRTEQRELAETKSVKLGKRNGADPQPKAAACLRLASRYHQHWTKLQTAVRVAQSAKKCASQRLNSETNPTNPALPAHCCHCFHQPQTMHETQTDYRTAAKSRPTERRHANQRTTQPNGEMRSSESWTRETRMRTWLRRRMARGRKAKPRMDRSAAHRKTAGMDQHSTAEREQQSTKNSNRMR